MSSRIDSLTMIDSKVKEHLRTAENLIQQRDFALVPLYVGLYPSNEITLKLGSSDITTAHAPIAHQALDAAIQMWRGVLGSRVNVRLVAGGNTNITLKYKRSVYHGGTDVAGYSQIRRQVVPPSVIPAHLKLASQTSIRWLGTDEQPFSLAAMKHTIAHEIGHVLGLDDNRVEGIMSPLDPVRPVSAVSALERSSLMALFRVCDDLLAEANRP